MLRPILFKKNILSFFKHYLNCRMYFDCGKGNFGYYFFIRLIIAPKAFLKGAFLYIVGPNLRPKILL